MTAPLSDERRCRAMSKRSGERCKRAAIVGGSTCATHGSGTRAAKEAGRRRAAAASAAAAVVTLGLPRVVEPGVALLEEVHRTAGHVAWLGELVAGLEHGVGATGYDVEWVDGGDGERRQVMVPRSGLKQLDASGRFEKPSVWVELYQAERKHLSAVCKAALDAGIAERQVRLAESQGALLAGAVRRILDALDLSAAQLALVPTVVPRELRAISDGGGGL